MNNYISNNSHRRCYQEMVKYCRKNNILNTGIILSSEIFLGYDCITWRHVWVNDAIVMGYRFYLAYNGAICAMVHFTSKCFTCTQDLNTLPDNLKQHVLALRVIFKEHFPTT